MRVVRCELTWQSDQECGLIAEVGPACRSQRCDIMTAISEAPTGSQELLCARAIGGVVAWRDIVGRKCIGGIELCIANPRGRVQKMHVVRNRRCLARAGTIWRACIATRVVWTAVWVANAAAGAAVRAAEIVRILRSIGASPRTLLTFETAKVDAIVRATGASEPGPVAASVGLHLGVSNKARVVARKPRVVARVGASIGSLRRPQVRIVRTS